MSALPAKADIRPISAKLTATNPLPPFASTAGRISVMSYIEGFVIAVLTACL